MLRCAAQQELLEAMCCHSNQHRCCLTPVSSLTWGSEDGMCPFSSGSKAAAASPVPLEKDQHAFVPQHHIMHSPFSLVSVPFPFSYPLPLSPTDPQPLSHTDLQQSLHCPGVSASGSEFLTWSKEHKVHLMIWTEKDESS